MIEVREFFNVTWKEKNHHLKIFKTSFTIDEKLPYFEGHFPENPILPAIAIIDFSLLAIENILEGPVILNKIKAAKFMGVVTPHDVIELVFQVQEGLLNWKIDWIKNAKVISELNLVIQKL